MPRLRRSDPAGPGYRRIRRGRGWSFTDQHGARLSDADDLARIAALAIPPAWNAVWISPTAHGHIQATGVDARGRTQYIYHQQWTAQRGRAKFAHLVEFGTALPQLRRRVATDLNGENAGKQQVLACAVRLLDLGLFRIGSDNYAEDNDTYGLATLQRRHVSVGGKAVTFDFDAKGSIRRLQTVSDPKVTAVVTQLKARHGGGGDLLAYRDVSARGRVRWRDVHSDDVNSYLRERAGIDCSAKDFRTWNATVLAAVALAAPLSATSVTARRRMVSQAVRDVADHLGNTPAVARRAYIDPRVVDMFNRGITVAPELSSLGRSAASGRPVTHGRAERAVLTLLTENT